MNNKLSNLLLVIILLINSGLPKSSQDIQSDINTRNKELNKIKNEIQNLEYKINSKTRQEVKESEILLDLNKKIKLTEDLITSLSKEEIYLSKKINKSESQITGLNLKLNKMRAQLKERIKYLYVYGRTNSLKVFFDFNNWNKTIYKVKYLESIHKEEQSIKQQINKSITELQNNVKKNNANLSRKKNLRLEKKIEKKRIKNDKQKKELLLVKIENEKKILEKKLIDKEQLLSDIKNIVDRLYKNQEAAKKREAQLAKIRREQQKAASGNFISMKGKLIWPANGKVINKFGLNVNPITKTKTDNAGVDIEALSGTPVISVLDGVVSTIAFIRNFGNIVIIDHGDGFSTVYAKIDNIEVVENSYVQTGTKIAEVGNFQNSKDTFHFEIWGNKKKQNPEYWLIKK